MSDLAVVAARLRVPEKELCGAWRVGSRVYGCAQPTSDHDYLVVRTSGRPDLIRDPNLNILVYTREGFQGALYNHSMIALEAWFAPEAATLKAANGLQFSFNQGRLRASARETSDSDWKKAVRLWEDELDASQKKLYHAIRVLMFARQLEQHGQIVDFGEANPVWEAVRNSVDWEEFVPLRTELLQG